MKIDRKMIVVTGAGSGIGRELALLLLARGAKVAGADVNAAALAETTALAESSDFAEFVVDITSRSAVESLPAKVIARFGAVDGIINNAGIIQPFLRLNDLDYATIERVLNVNLMGTLFATKAFLPHLLERPEAHIVNLSSMGGFIAVPGQTMYCAAKAAVKLMSQGLGSELIGTPVRVTVVFPGAITTNIRENSGLTGLAAVKPLGSGMKPLSPRKAAEVIVAAIERDAHNVFVGRDASIMDKLSRLSPTLAIRTVANHMKHLLQARP
jgi:NADP-dependent 3-hydroxy acid dehydrogenase YdfG